MPPRDNGRPGERADASPAAREQRRFQLQPEDHEQSGHAPPTDAGRTSGGGSLGHDQPSDVEEQTHTRNAARTPTRSKSAPVMPDDDSTLNTKI